MNFNNKSLETTKNILWFLIFGVYPIFLVKGYSNVQGNRVGFFSVCFLTLGSLIFYYLNKRRLLSGETLCRKKTDIYETFALLFLLSVTFSAVFSKYREVAIDGRTNSYIGLFWYTLMVLFFLLCKNEFKPRPWMYLVICVANWIIVIFSCIQFSGHDIFNMLSGLKTDSIQNFLSTFGNVGVFGQYITLMLIPVSSVCMSKNKWYYHVVGIITAGFLTCGIAMSNTDATYLGCVITVILLFVVSIRNYHMLAGFFEMFFGMTVGNGIFSLAYRNMRYGRALSKMSGCMVQGGLIWMLIFGGISLVLIIEIRLYLKKVEDIRSEIDLNKTISHNILKNDGSESRKTPLAIISNILFMIVIILIIMVFISFFYFSAIDRKTDLGSLEKLLRFTRHWGTDRGYIWLYVWGDYLGGGLLRHILGFGEGTMEIELVANHLEQLRYEAGFIPSSAHNLYLHMLFTIGISGAGILFSGFFYTLVRGYKIAIKRFRDNYTEAVLSFCIIASVIGYMAQSAVSMTEPDVMPYVVLCLAILAGIGSEKKMM